MSPYEYCCKAHRTQVRLFEELLEFVMAMGWTRVSLIAQDLGNACV